MRAPRRRTRCPVGRRTTKSTKPPRNCSFSCKWTRLVRKHATEMVDVRGNVGKLTFASASGRVIAGWVSTRAPPIAPCGWVAERLRAPQSPRNLPFCALVSHAYATYLIYMHNGPEQSRRHLTSTTRIESFAAFQIRISP